MDKIEAELKKAHASRVPQVDITVEGDCKFFQRWLGSNGYISYIVDERGLHPRQCLLRVDLPHYLVPTKKN